MKIPTLIEAGHYYLSKGPTKWSNIGGKIAENLKHQYGKVETMLFLDDVHSINEVSPYEVDHPVVPLQFNADHVVYESEMIEPALQLLEVLKELPKKRRARPDSEGRYYISGFPVTNKFGKPLCVLLDAALTLKKYEMGFKRTINILPFYYKEQQENLFRILNKIMPHGLEHRTLLFDEHGHELGFMEQKKFEVAA